MSLPLHPLIAQRHSTKTFLDRPIPHPVLLRLFEAARWAPSCFNEQPWRFVVAARDTDPAGFAAIASTISPGNAWALSAPVLGASIADMTFSRNGKPNRWGPYDTGQAIAQLSLQAQQEGLNIHQMGGFDPAKAVEVLSIPAGHEVMAVFAIGYPADPNPPTQRSRRPMDAFLFGGKFGNPYPSAAD